MKENSTDAQISNKFLEELKFNVSRPGKKSISDRAAVEKGLFFEILSLEWSHYSKNWGPFKHCDELLSIPRSGLETCFCLKVQMNFVKGNVKQYKKNKVK